MCMSQNYVVKVMRTLYAPTIGPSSLIFSIHHCYQTQKDNIGQLVSTDALCVHCSFKYVVRKLKSITSCKTFKWS